MINGNIEGYDLLKELALNLRWSWNHAADQIWKNLDPQLWELTRNPRVVLQTVSKEKLIQALADPRYRQIIEKITEETRQELQSDGWYNHTYPDRPISCIAYFSMEFMITEAIPIYSGGLGNVAGDQLKSASDLNIPVIGIGLLYQQGYFRQIIDKEGNQQALYPYNDPGQLPVSPLRMPNGEWLRIEIKLPGYSLWLRTWEVNVGRVKLYLLDSNDTANFPIYRGITSELYGGDSELRLEQELLLGIGGWRLLKALNINPEVAHLNEGHAAFVILERAKCYMKETGVSFETALAITRAGNLFTTHTAVPAGFDRFSPELIEKYLGNYATNVLGISIDQLLALGRQNPRDDAEPFNMAYLAIRGCGMINGVSRLHGEVSRNLFSSLFPRWPEKEVPVNYVTNGVHMPSWDSVYADELWTKTCGKPRWLSETECLRKQIQCITDSEIWKMRHDARAALVVYTRKKLEGQLRQRGASEEDVEQSLNIFDSNTLTLGFSRRFATYKRPDMLLHDPERLVRILKNPQYPVQLILAGKAHPADLQGRELIRRWMQFIERSDVRSHVVFISDYDMLIAEQLVQGVDVWINTPRRPWEACGTSGMKVLVNGGLNVSELDGWWAEAYSPEVGWAIGDLQEHGENREWDASEAYALYDLLEKEVIPEFYHRNESGIPEKWVSRIRESMSRLTPQFSANRAVREYLESCYLPAARNYSDRAADNGAVGKKIVDWEKSLKINFHKVRFGDVNVNRGDNGHVIFHIHVYLNGIDPGAVRVQLFAEGNPPEVYVMERKNELSNASQMFLYSADLKLSRPPEDFTARIIPYFPGVSVPLEYAEILWQK